MKRPRLLTPLAFLLISVSTFSQTTTQLRQELQASQRVSQLEVKGGKPFHAVGTFTLFGDDGVVAAQGTIDELWKDPTTYRRIITLPDRTLVEVDNVASAWRTGDWVFPGGLLQLLDVFTPFRRGAFVTNRLGLITRTRDLILKGSSGETVQIPDIRRAALAVEQITTEPEIPDANPKLPIAQTIYTIDKSTHQLESINRGEGESILFQVPRLFANQSISRGIVVNDVSAGGRSGISRRIGQLHLTTLEQATDFSELDAAPPPGAHVLKARSTDSIATDELVVGQRIVEIGDIIPNSTRPNTPYEILVLLKLHIDTTGKVTSVTVLKAADKYQGEYAAATAKRWHYRVSYQSGHLIGVDRIIEVSVGPQGIMP